MGNETLQASPPQTAKPKLGWGEKREIRRRRRHLFEEALGWILVPALIYAAYLGYQASGGIPEDWLAAGMDIFRAITGSRE